MRRVNFLLVIGITLMLAAACGKSEEQKAAEKAAEETREAAEALQKAAESAGSAGTAQGLQEFAKAMEGMAGAMSGTTPDGKPVEPVSFQTALPELSGWERSTPTGERMTAPIAFSEAETHYTTGETNVSVKIVDSAFSQMLVAPWAMFLTAGYERESSEGYEKSVNVGGNPGFERWNKDSKTGELNLVVAKRYLVTVEGDNLNDTKVLHEFASKIDAGKLSSLK
jgi:hypothetical protein